MRSMWSPASLYSDMGGNLLNISMNTQAIGTEALYGRTIMASYHGIWSVAGFSGAAIGTLFIRLGWLPYQHFLVITCPRLPDRGR